LSAVRASCYPNAVANKLWMICPIAFFKLACSVVSGAIDTVQHDAWHLTTSATTPFAGTSLVCGDE